MIALKSEDVVKSFGFGAPGESGPSWITQRGTQA